MDRVLLTCTECGMAVMIDRPLVESADQEELDALRKCPMHRTKEEPVVEAEVTEEEE